MLILVPNTLLAAILLAMNALISVVFDMLAAKCITKTEVSFNLSIISLNNKLL